MKHKQNKQRTLLHDEKLEVCATGRFTLRRDSDLLTQIKQKTKIDTKLQTTIKALQQAVTRDTRVPLGLCELHEGMVIKEG